MDEEEVTIDMFNKSCDIFSGHSNLLTWEECQEEIDRAFPNTADTGLVTSDVIKSESYCMRMR